MPYVTTEPGAMDDAPKGGTQRLVEAQEKRLSGDRVRDKQIEYLATQIEKLEARIPTLEQQQWLAQRTTDAANLAWLRAKVRAWAPWLLPVFGVLGAAFVWFSSNAINIMPKQ